ncbi:unnamed protein product [Wickerhamomyces anomalus]
MSLFGSGAECSTARNPLSQFTKHTNEDRSLQRPGLNQQINNQGGIREETRMNQHDQQVRQDSFNFQPMNHELAHIHPHQQPQGFRQSPSSNWSSEFKTDSPLQHSGSLRSNGSRWSSEFNTSTASPMSSTTTLSEPQSHANPMVRQRIGGFNPVFSSYHNGMVNHVQPVHTNSKIAEVGNNEQWEDRFKEIDEQFQDAFSKQEGKQNEEELKDQEKNADPEIIIDDKYQTNFDEVWESLNSQTVQDDLQAEPSWEKDFATYAQARANFGKYQFEQTNQFLNNPSAYEIGVTLMEQGAKLSEAALAFEAAIQENPRHTDAWLKLGEVQTQNEKEIAGLTALEKCLSLDPNNLSALMTLAVSYINEGYDNAAFATLERWIETKYPQVTDKARSTNPKINDEDRFSLNKRVTELFIQAAQLSPAGANIDADVQMGLGVLFYANEEFEKTIDCFKAALAVRPNDELLWNRLGASLANSNRSEEAIEAYQRALQLKPSFVRARYNLGVSSINIGCYKEAAEHLLGALSMHKVEGLDDDDLRNNAIANQSTSILETLKRAFVAMNRRDLIEKVKPGMNLNQFRGEFNF